MTTTLQRNFLSHKKIAQIEDHYTKENSIFHPIDGGYSLTVSRFDGRQTLWNKKLPKKQNIKIDISFQLAKGHAKIVHIDSRGNVTTLIECSSKTSTERPVIKTVTLEKGQNWLKIVGYDCKNIDMKILFAEPNGLN
ncbi:hypothetical protein D7V86_10590 [bacterium D16-51]|nr:hypothetical protein D7V96_11355 [bacterium D16-59]RKI59945.1 hypothetical protein D7V86_10590 [bacterium D16-51]